MNNASETLINTLDEAIHITVKKLLNSSNLIVSKKNKNVVLIGRLKIVNTGNEYKICMKNVTLYDNIYLLESAVFIAERIIAKRPSKIKDILEQDGIYAKHKTDMLNYIHVMKGENKDVIVDRYEESAIRAKYVRTKILGNRLSM